MVHGRPDSKRKLVELQALLDSLRQQMALQRARILELTAERDDLAAELAAVEVQWDDKMIGGLG